MSKPRLAHFRIELDKPLPVPGVVKIRHAETGKGYWRRSDGRSMRQLMEDQDGWIEGEPPAGAFPQGALSESPE